MKHKKFGMCSKWLVTLSLALFLSVLCARGAGAQEYFVAAAPAGAEDGSNAADAGDLSAGIAAVNGGAATPLIVVDDGSGNDYTADGDDAANGLEGFTSDQNFGLGVPETDVDVTFGGIVLEASTGRKISSNAEGAGYGEVANTGTGHLEAKAPGMNVNRISQPAVQIPDLSASDDDIGNEVVVPVVVGSLDNVGSISLSILFDSAVLTFVGSQNAVADFALQAGEPMDGRVNIGGFSVAGADIPDGALIELLFTYNGGGTTLTFDEEASEVTDATVEPYDTRFVGGSVGTVAGVDQFEAILGGIHEVAGDEKETVETTGTGNVVASLRDRRLTVQGSFESLTSDFADNIGVHIHMGAPATNGDILIPLNPKVDADARGGIFEPADNLFDLDEDVAYPEGFTADDFIDALQAGGTYVNLHTMAHPGGEIRGQLLPAPNTAPTASEITSIDDSAEIQIGGLTRDDAVDPDTPLFEVTSSAATDAEDNTVVYIFQRALDADFVTTFASNNAGPMTDFGGFTVGEAAAAFDEIADAGRDIGDAIDLYLRVVSSDGSRVTVGPTKMLTLIRGTVTDTEPATDLPTTFTINGNYPNPFNPSTTISFDLPETAQVSVQIADLLGRQVMAIPAHTVQAGAARTIGVDASALPSGLYIYRVIARSATQTRVEAGRMTLIK